MTDSSERSSVEPVLWADIRYHLELGVRLIAAGRSDEAASETALALALLRNRLGSAAEAAQRDLPPAEAVAADGAAVAAIHARARALAMEIQAHYVSEGQHELATAYEDAASWLASTA